MTDVIGAMTQNGRSQLLAMHEQPHVIIGNMELEMSSRLPDKAVGEIDIMRVMVSPEPDHSIYFCQSQVARMRATQSLGVGTARIDRVIINGFQDMREGGLWDLRNCMFATNSGDLWISIRPNITKVGISTNECWCAECRVQRERALGHEVISRDALTDDRVRIRFAANQMREMYRLSEVPMRLGSVRYTLEANTNQ